MIKCLVWLGCTYLTLKFIQVVFVSWPVMSDAAPTLRQRLVRGEPILFSVAFALSVPTALANSWYLQRGYSRSLERSADCYGRLQALDQLPGLRVRYDPYAIFQTVEAAEQSAVIAGQALDLEPARIAGMLAQRIRFHTQRYAVLARRGQAQTVEVATITRCLREPFLNL